MGSGTSAGRRPWRRARRCDAPGGGEFDRGGSCSGAEAVAVAGIPGGCGTGVFVSLVRQVSIRGRGAGFRRPSHWALSQSDCLRRWDTRTRQGRRGKKRARLDSHSASRGGVLESRDESRVSCHCLSARWGIVSMSRLGRSLPLALCRPAACFTSVLAHQSASGHVNGNIRSPSRAGRIG